MQRTYTAPMSESNSERYDIAFAGECLDGHALADVRAGVAKLFKADESTLNRLFSGTSQRIKRNCDKATALKYQKAMNAIGARVTISGVSSAATESQQAAEVSKDSGANSKSVSDTPTDRGSPESQGSALELAPAGTEVLRAEERQAVQEATINTAHLSIADTGTTLSDPVQPLPSVSVPDFEIADVGATLDEQAPNSAVDTTPHDLSAFELAPAEHDLSDCVPPSSTAPQVSLDHLKVEEAGGDLLRSEERAEQSVKAPDTSHLSVTQD